MKHFRFNHVIILVLIVLSILFFILQQIVFNDIHETGFLFFQDLFFLPLNILFVTFVLDRILQSREKRERLEKINIVISAFFSEVGSTAIEELNPAISDFDDLCLLLNMTPEWAGRDFEQTAGSIKSYTFSTGDNEILLESLKETLIPKKAYLLQMFSNPNLLEHNTFTDMLWALYHLIDELENRQDVKSLPDTDIKHLSGDIVRAYGLLVYEWVFYMKHLKERYPYLWSLAVRKNPFAGNSVIIK